MKKLLIISVLLGGINCSGQNAFEIEKYEGYFFQTVSKNIIEILLNDNEVAFSICWKLTTDVFHSIEDTLKLGQISEYLILHPEIKLEICYYDFIRSGDGGHWFPGRRMEKIISFFTARGISSNRINFILKENSRDHNSDPPHFIDGCERCNCRTLTVKRRE